MREREMDQAALAGRPSVESAKCIGRPSVEIAKMFACGQKDSRSITQTYDYWWFSENRGSIF